MTPHRIQLGHSHVLDFLNDVRPIDIIHPLPAREPAQRIGLMSGPSENVLFVARVGHGQEISEGPTMKPAAGTGRPAQSRSAVLEEPRPLIS
jgi:hypothetical protein